MQVIQPVQEVTQVSSEHLQDSVVAVLTDEVDEGIPEDVHEVLWGTAGHLVGGFGQPGD